MKKVIALVLALTLIFAIPVVANADNSPSGTPTNIVKVINVDGGTAVGTENPDGSYTVTVTVKDDYNFVKWNIEGSYTLVDCELTDETITFNYTTDITVTPQYQKKDTSSSTGSVDSDGDSPNTGDNNVYAIAVVTLLAFVAVAGVFVIKNKTVKE